MGQPNDSETGLTKAIKALDQREWDAYRYFLDHKQPEVAEDTADKFYLLYVQGKTCEEIRRLHKGFSYGQVVAARVRYEWDERRTQYRRHLQTEVPQRAQQVHIETVDFLADMLTATQQKVRESIALYLQTGDQAHLKDVPIPKSAKDLKDLMALFMTATGQDKKRVEFSGTVKVDGRTGMSTPVSSDEAAEIARQLLEQKVIDTTEAGK